MRRRIVVCLALLVALCLLGDAIAMLCLHTSIDQLTAVAESHRIQSLRAELASSGVRIQRDLLAAREAGVAAGQTASEWESLERFKAAVEDCSTCHHDEQIEGQLSNLHATYLAIRDQATRISGAGGNPLEDHETLRLVDEVVRQSTAMADCASQHLAVRSSDAAASVEKAWLVLCFSVIASLIVATVIALHLKRRLTTPVEALLEGIDRVREGDLDHRFAIESDEEFRTLGHAFNRAYESLQNAQQGVLQAEKMAAVGKMAAGIAHEVGNPLASISSVVQLMRRKCATPLEQERLELIMHHINRVSSIVRELLTFTRPAPDRPAGPVELNSLLDETVSLLRYDRRAQDARIVCHYDTGLILEHADADRLLLVFTNIVVNAFDAMSTACSDEPCLEISAFREGDAIVLSFRDNGPGMTAQQIDNAFEPFYTTKEPGAGTGLGLWISYQVVRKHNGRIHIDSKPEAGTTVNIEFPISPSKPHRPARLRRPADRLPHVHMEERASTDPQKTDS